MQKKESEMDRPNENGMGLGKIFDIILWIIGTGITIMSFLGVGSFYFIFLLLIGIVILAFALILLIGINKSLRNDVEHDKHVIGGLRGALTKEKKESKGKKDKGDKGKRKS